MKVVRRSKAISVKTPCGGREPYSSLSPINYII